LAGIGVEVVADPDDQIVTGFSSFPSLLSVARASSSAVPIFVDAPGSTSFTGGGGLR
jgi:hypothetical protein